jgi:hypothetical protein
MVLVLLAFSNVYGGNLDLPEPNGEYFTLHSSVLHFGFAASCLTHAKYYKLQISHR